MAKRVSEKNIVKDITLGGMGNGGATLQNDSYTSAAWTPVYLSFDAISPWAVGRFGNNAGADSYTATITIPDLATCKSNGIDYMPVIFPVFSWFNENGGPLNQAGKMLRGEIPLQTTIPISPP